MMDNGRIQKELKELADGFKNVSLIPLIYFKYHVSEKDCMIRR